MSSSASLLYPDALLHLDAVSAKAVAIAMEDTRRVLKRRVLSGTPIDTGRLWSSWVITADAQGINISTDVPYAPYVELGGPPSNWPKAGPRTVSSQGKVWSRQAEGGILKPITDDESWLINAVNLIVELIKRQLK
jgi:hypothetical protein